MTGLLFVFESLAEYALHSAEQDLPLFRTQEFAKRSPTVRGPKPEVSPYGPYYRMYPELSRAGGPGVYYVAATATFVGVPVALAAMNYAVVENDVPEEERQGFWRMFSQALTGGFGANLSGLV